MAKASNKKKKGNETPFKKNAFDDIPDEINHRESNQANAYTILNKCITVGDKIELKQDYKGFKGKGTVKFVGELNSKDGVFYGIELTKKKGIYNGTVGDITYFKTEDKKASFVTIDKIKYFNIGNNTNPRISYGFKVKPNDIDCIGTVRYVGNPTFADNDELYYGIELTKKKGNCDGEVDGARYFVATQGYAIFLQANQFEVIAPKSKNQKKKTSHKKKNKKDKTTVNDDIKDNENSDALFDYPNDSTSNMEMDSPNDKPTKIIKKKFIPPKPKKNFMLS
mmetsp:Transcript_39283/g.48655  ORF Transcript_39283/g.48655 Transcript_39283/m.48655 type:complete len:280 (+) Transcript_39283:21-860(+)